MAIAWTDSQVGHAEADAEVDTDATTDEDDTGDDLPADGAVTPRRRGRAGSAIGRAVHATLQLIDLAAPRDVEAQARRQCELEGIAELTDDVLAMVHSTLDSPIIRMAASSTHHKELYVAAPVGDRTIEGYVDLLVETPDGLVIVDYKTDAVRSDADADERLAHHRLQGAAYAVALSITTGLPVVGCHFVFCGKRGSRERAITNLDAAMAEVRALLAA